MKKLMIKIKMTNILKIKTFHINKMYMYNINKDVVNNFEKEKENNEKEINLGDTKNNINVENNINAENKQNEIKLIEKLKNEKITEKKILEILSKNTEFLLGIMNNNFSNFSKLTYRGYNIFYIFISSLIIITLILYFTWDNIKIWTGLQSAEVASKTLSDEQVKIKAEELSKNVVNKILLSPSTLDLTISFLNRLSTDKGTLEATVKIMENWLKDDSTKDISLEFVSNLFKFIFF
jgi:hypothetical protein